MEADEVVTLAITYPDKTVETKVLVAQPWDTLVNYAIVYDFPLSLNMQAGDYHIVFDGESGKFEQLYRVGLSSTPHLYSVSHNNSRYLVFYGFTPEETIRILCYQTISEERWGFVGWKAYQANQDGRLLIEIVEGGSYFFALGNDSGLIEDSSDRAIPPGRHLKTLIHPIIEDIMTPKSQYAALFLATILLVSCKVTFTSTTSTGGDPTPVPFTPFVTEPPIPQAQSAGSGHFSPENANSVAPDSVLEEVAYFATGGPDACFGASEPEVQDLPETVEWVQDFALITCGWEEGEEVNVTIISPNGSSFSERNIAQVQGMDLSPSVMYFITPSAVGQYQFIFEGENTTLNITIPVYKPLFPRMHVWTDNSKVVLYSLKSNENVMLLAYSVNSAAGTINLEGWDEFQADSDGTLVVDISDTSLVYFAIGEVSGYLQEEDTKLHIDGPILR